MYMETRAHTNYWATENFCGKWSLKTGSCIIASVTTVWSAICILWVFLVFHLDCHEPERECMYMPGPEIKTISAIMPEKKEAAVRAAIVGVAVFHTLYLVFSLMVFVGITKKIPILLSGWVALTSLYMVLVMADLLITLPYTTLVHLLMTLAHFIAALCAWVVVKSHRQQMRVLQAKPPIPENALLDYTVDGIDKIALDPAP